MRQGSASKTEKATLRESGFEKKGGQVLMGPRQPKPPVQKHVPPPPPRGK